MQVKEKAIELLSSGKVSRVLGWKLGELGYDLTPAVFKTAEEVEQSFVFSALAGANLAKYLIAESRKDGKVAAFLKPCDSYSVMQLLKEHRIRRENVYLVGVQCEGTVDPDKLRDAAKGLTAVRDEGSTLVCDTLYGEKTVDRAGVLLERCKVCKSKKIVVFDELLGENGEENPESTRFDAVAEIENLTPDERYAFWQKELSRCIRCNACRNVCPACSCETCVFDNAKLGTENKAPASSFEEQYFHIIRAFHVAGRCTDCGECSRVCPQKIPLHLLNRKFIKDMNALYGQYQAGADEESLPPMTDFRTDDCEPGQAWGGKQA